MFKIVFILLIGFAAGYSYGWKDAQVHAEDVVSRTVDRVAHLAGGKYNQNVDQTMERLEH